MINSMIEKIIYQKHLPHLRLAVISDCNFSCKYCRDGGEGILTKEYMQLDEMVKVLEIASEVGFKHLKITGGEPLIREKKFGDLIKLIKIVAKKKLFEDIQLVTNGSFLSEYAKDLSTSGLNSLTVSLDTADPVEFKELTGQDKFHNVVQGISKVREYGLPVVINSVVFKQNIRELPNLIGIAQRYRTKLKFLDYIDMSAGTNDWQISYVSLRQTMNYLKSVCVKEDILLPPGGLGTPMPVYILNDGTEVIIKDASIGTNYNELCKECKHYPCQDALISLRVTSNGLLKKCLIRDDNLVNIIDDLRKGDYLAVKGSLESSHKILMESKFMKNAWNPVKLIKNKETIKNYLVSNNFENPEMETRIISELLDAGTPFEEVMSLLEKKIPVQFLAKYTYVKGEKILFEEKVLLPGPEIDVMIDFIMKYIKPGLRVLDLCTGSGVIAITLAKIFSGSEFYASDISDDAIKNTKKNIEFHNLSNVKLLQGDLFEPIENNKIINLDVIIFNPPFCRTVDIEMLSDQVKNNVPLIAIDGGLDGLYFFKKILSLAGAYLKKNAIIILQHEIGQAKEIKELILQNSFEKIEIGYDHSGNEKYIAARYI